MQPDRDIIVDIITFLWQKCKLGIQRISVSKSDFAKYSHKISTNKVLPFLSWECLYLNFLNSSWIHISSPGLPSDLPPPKSHPFQMCEVGSCSLCAYWDLPGTCVLPHPGPVWFQRVENGFIFKGRNTYKSRPCELGWHSSTRVIVWAPIRRKHQGAFLPLIMYVSVLLGNIYCLAELFSPLKRKWGIRAS